MDKVTASLKVAYKKLEKEKMAVILALQFLTSRKFPLRADITKKSFELSNLPTELSSSEYTIKDQSLELSLKDG